MDYKMVGIVINNDGRFTKDMVSSPIVKDNAWIGVITDVDNEVAKGVLFADLLPEYNINGEVVGFILETK